MTIKDMKDILFQKLQDEQTSFKKSDISIKKVTCTKPKYRKYKIVIKDFEHEQFTMYFEYDKYFGYIVTVFNADYETLAFIDNKKEYNIKSALIEIGYYIGTRF